MGNYGLKAKDGRDVVIPMFVFGALALVSTILRTVARRMRKVGLGIDDYCMMVATVRSMSCGYVWNVTDEEHSA